LQTYDDYPDSIEQSRPARRIVSAPVFFSAVASPLSPLIFAARVSVRPFENQR
jgi:hypothetical protein